MVNFRKNIQKMQGYVPGEQPPSGAQVIKLNTNENPYPPSPEVMRLLLTFEADWLRRYPQPDAMLVREAAAEVYGVPVDCIMAANGSDEMLAILARAFLDSGSKVAYPAPTYSLYTNLAEMQDADVVEIPYNEDYDLPVQELLEVQANLTFVCSPNNPSGTLAANSDLEQLAAGLQGVLVIDEAYCDFAEQNALELVLRHENVIVLRTLSKGYSLAGLRLGLGIAAPELLAGLAKIKDSYNVDAFALRLGAAALRDQAWMRAQATEIKLGREELATALTNLGCKVWPSQANFLMITPPNSDAGSLYRHLREHGIIVRYWDEPRLVDKMRITVGSEDENQVLLTELKELLRS